MDLETTSVLENIFPVLRRRSHLVPLRYVDNPRGSLSDILPQLRPVYIQNLSVFLDNLAVDHHGVEVANVSIEHECSDRVDDWHDVHVVAPRDEQVGALAWRDAADHVIEADHFRTTQCCHVERLLALRRDVDRHFLAQHWLPPTPALGLEEEAHRGQHVVALIAGNVDANANVASSSGGFPGDRRSHAHLGFAL